MRIRLLNRTPLYDYKEFNKISQGIDLDLNCIVTPADETAFWIKQIVNNHSTLRCIHFRVIDKRPRSVIMQLIRATKGHPQPVVATSRPDWCNGKERSSDPYEEKLFGHDHTPESFIAMCMQRLCKRTEERTRKATLEVVEELKRSSEPVLKAVGYCCAPACFWYNACPEIKGCNGADKLYDRFLSKYRQNEAAPNSQGGI